MELLEKSAWFAELLLEAERFDFSLFPPIHAPVQETEKVIGVCPEYLRKLYALAQMFSREKDRLVVEQKYMPKGTPGEPGIVQEAVQLGTKEDLLREIMWACLRQELHVYDDNIGIREDWQVVTYVDHRREFVEFLRQRLEE